MQVSSKSIAIAGVLSLSLGACDPGAKNVGNGLGTDSATSGGSDGAGTGADGDSGTGGESLGDAPAWVSLLPGGRFAVRMARMPDGGVVVATHRPGTGEDVLLVRYSDTGTILWEVPLGHSVLDLETLDDGRIFAAGEIDQAGLRAAVWRVSPTGTVEALQIHPLPGAFEESHSGAYKLSLSEAGIAYTVLNWGADPGVPRAELWRADLDLVAQWSWSDFPRDPDDVAFLPSGELRTLEPTGPDPVDYLMRSFSADGTPLGTELVPPVRFADDAPLVQAGVSNDQLWVQGLENSSGLTATFDGYGMTGVSASAHGPGVALAVIGDQELLELLQLGPDGQVRELALPSPCFDYVAALDVAIGLDGSMFASGYCLPQSQPPVEDWSGFVLALPPM